MEQLKKRLGRELLLFDGGMGTLLQESGLKPGELPETWNLTHKEDLIEIHRQYCEAGSNLILANTFGANALKFHDATYSLKDIIYAAVENAKEGAKRAGKEVYIALDVGPTGKLLKPMGDLGFEQAYETFKESVIYGVEAGADLIHIETMSDTYEVKAAVLAAKENSNLPVTATMIFDERGKLLTGANVAAVVAMLEGLRVDALGINCGLGPKQMVELVKEFRTYTDLPLIVKPNAGLPKQKDGAVYYDVSPEQFADYMKQIVSLGAQVIGGCCGTTPEHIRILKEVCGNMELANIPSKQKTLVSSYGQAVVIGKEPIIIGERINPTGKSKFKQALKDHDLDYILKEAITQEEKGAHILDVNVGLPDIDECQMMKEVVASLQSVTSLPLQIDTTDQKTMEQAMRLYNGKPMINSVNGKQESMDMIFPLVQKYGGVVVGLTLDESGIPQTAKERVEIAGKIIAEAAKYGISKKDIVIDVLTMTISSDPDGAKTTLKALEMVTEKYGVGTVLGVSNISFGLPRRPVINGTFYTMALQKGLSAGIINPSSEPMKQAYDSYMALFGYDTNCMNYIESYKDTVASQSVKINQSPETNQKANQTGDGKTQTLNYAIERGLKEEAVAQAKTLLESQAALEIINQYMIPALDHVGKGFEAGTIFLPQLLMSADAAKAAFEVLKDHMSASGEKQESIGKVIMATVKGDIHDIGKNIVKVLLENYGFDVIDLGKDVAPDVICQTALEQEVTLVGLSALMTTTVVSMEETIKLLRKEKPDCKVMVGGAVLNQEYADMIGADFYGKDAMQSVYYAKECLDVHK